ncbi:MAG: DNA repair protein RecN [Candidatus Melainabacteria bacterium]|nr:DNA repair protein RecN [Candidatus Melainabacteria bacterium]
MITALNIENIAVFEKQIIEFKPGITVITGEAGAGKSLLTDAIHWAFGSSVHSKNILRTGAKSGKVEVTIDVTPEQKQTRLLSILKENGIEIDTENESLVFSREFTETSSRCRVNGTLVSKSFLETIKPNILEIQSQHASISLLQPGLQMSVLDALGGDVLINLKKEASKIYQQWKQIKELSVSQASLYSEQLRQKAFIEFQLQELQAGNLKNSAEDVECRNLLTKLTHQETLKETTKKILEVLDNQSEWGRAEVIPGIIQQLYKVQKELQNILRIDNKLTPYVEKIDSLLIETKDVFEEIYHYHSDLNTEPETLKILIERLDELERIKKKYGPSIEEAINRQKTLQTELEDLSGKIMEPELLKTQLNDLEMKTLSIFKHLSLERNKLKELMELRVTQALQQMALPSAQFRVQMTETSNWSTQGYDQIEFLFSANPGESLRPLNKVASGGELSRVLLALTSLTASASEKRSYLFDEIDTGTSGPSAQAVAQELMRLAQEGQQVFVITHQPIIAAIGDQHLHVKKLIKTEQNHTRTYSKVEPLEQREQRLSILSVLASGVEQEDKTTESFANQLLVRSEEIKSQQAV